jgi:hypothetical protein
VLHCFQSAQFGALSAASKCVAINLGAWGFMEGSMGVYLTADILTSGNLDSEDISFNLMIVMSMAE